MHDKFFQLQHRALQPPFQGKTICVMVPRWLRHVRHICAAADPPPSPIRIASIPFLLILCNPVIFLPCCVAVTLTPARFDYTSTRLVHRQGTISYTMTDDRHVLVSAAALCCTLAITVGQILLEDMRQDQQAIMFAQAMEGPATLDAHVMLLSLFGSSGRHISMRGM